MDRAAQHACERDSKDKHHAQHLDDRMHQLRNSSNGIGFQPGIENVDNTWVFSYTWFTFIHLYFNVNLVLAAHVILINASITI